MNNLWHSYTTAGLVIHVGYWLGCAWQEDWNSPLKNLPKTEGIAIEF